MVKTLNPAAFMIAPIDAVVMPFPSEEQTPPVTKIYFEFIEKKNLNCLQVQKFFIPI